MTKIAVIQSLLLRSIHFFLNPLIQNGNNMWLLNTMSTRMHYFQIKHTFERNRLRDLGEYGVGMLESIGRL